jgi:hypothetical protein
MSAISAALLLASAPLAAADSAALDAATAAIYAPYSHDGQYSPPWERDIWTREIRDLIARWQASVREDEPDALNGGDWLCQCQDWDSRSFRVRIISRTSSGPDVAELSVAVHLGHGARRAAILRFRREDQRWLLDDMVSDDFPDSLKVATHQTIAENEALKKAMP